MESTSLLKALAIVVQCWWLRAFLANFVFWELWWHAQMLTRLWVMNTWHVLNSCGKNKKGKESSIYGVVLSIYFIWHRYISSWVNLKGQIQGYSYCKLLYLKNIAAELHWTVWSLIGTFSLHILLDLASFKLICHSYIESSCLGNLYG